MELFEIELIIYVKMDLVLNNLQRLICHKIQPTKLKSQTIASEFDPHWVLFIVTLFHLGTVYYNLVPDKLRFKKYLRRNSVI